MKYTFQNTFVMIEGLVLKPKQSFIRNSVEYRWYKLTLYFIAVIFIFIIAPFHLFGQIPGSKFTRNYTYKDYDHQPQNWAITQTGNGLIYAANNGGVLEYDGVNWRVIKAPGYAPVRSLAIGENGTIYVGGHNDLGYLAPGEKGTLIFCSLTDYIPAGQKDFSMVWGTYAIDRTIYFETSKYLFLWVPHEKKMIGAPHGFSSLYSTGGNLFARCKKSGLRMIVGIHRRHVQSEPVPGGGIFYNKKIFALIPYDNRRLLVGTERGGLFIQDVKTFVPFPTGADEFLKTNLLSHGIRLSSGDFALATRKGGLVVIDASGRPVYFSNESSGLQDNNIKYLFQDYGGNVWLCLNNGISKIEYSSPWFFWDKHTNLTGLVLSAVRHHGQLFAGTSDGLFSRGSDSGFRPVPGLSGNCRSLLSTGDTLLAASESGIYRVTAAGCKNLIRSRGFILMLSRVQGRGIWCGIGTGLMLLTRKNGGWIQEKRFVPVKQGIRFIAEEKNGNLWLFTISSQLLNVDFSLGLDKPVVNAFDSSNGIPRGRVYMSIIDKHVTFATAKGLFRFDRTEKRFIPDPVIGPEFTGGENGKNVFFMVEAPGKQVWIHSESRNYLAVPDTGGTYSLHAVPFLRLPLSQTNSIYPDPGGEGAWFAGYDGLFYFDRGSRKTYDLKFFTHIRRVTVGGDVIFNGSKTVGNRTDGTESVIEYPKRKNLRFTFSAAFYEGEHDIMYRCYLEGHDNRWSGWSNRSGKEYSNLEPGHYRFRVQARNVYMHPGTEANYRFNILPPWYKTWWAYSVYGSMLLALMFTVVRWRSRQLMMEKNKLERVVIDRTKEILDKNRQLEIQTGQLKKQSEQLKELDNVKSRFFTNISHEFRTPLTLIMSPLEQLYDEETDEEKKEKIVMMLRNSRKVLTLINQLLDLSRFDDNKMTLKAAESDIVSFVKDIAESFRQLARQNRVELRFHAPVEPIPVYYDSQKIEEVVVNLLINALKFTPSGGTISIFVTVENKNETTREQTRPCHAVIAIRDTGIGIPKEKLPFIFDRFYQIEGGARKDDRGTGIGLALVRELVKLHHGKIDVFSREGKGTEFTIRLIMGNAHLKQSEMITLAPDRSLFHKKKVIDDLYIVEDNNGYQEGGKGFPTLDRSMAAGSRTEYECDERIEEKFIVLVVEDNPDMRNHIRSTLSPFYNVIEARDGRQGIEKAREVIPDLIVSDIMMPEIDGCQLVHQLKKDVKTSHIPIILLTAKASEDSILQGLEIGADDYVTKPFNTKILLTRIKNLIDLRRQLQLKIQRQKKLLPSEIAVTSTDETFLDEFQAVIEKNITDASLNVEFLCKKLYMGRTTLFRKVQALTGETPNQFILSYRLNRAAQLLRDNYGNVTDVAMAAGFSSSQYFATCFKKKFHRSPKEFQAAESASR